MQLADAGFYDVIAYDSYTDDITGSGRDNRSAPPLLETYRRKAATSVGGAYILQ